MNVTFTSLEALILKATHESLPCPDSAALEAFCAIMKDSAEGPQYAAQGLATRIHSTNPREAMLALTMLDRCMRRCDTSFHAEIGKFRFLNEMIKLVSPKYFATRTSPEVQTRVLQLLHAWSIEYPKESKFKVAYDMLKNQGVVKETPPPLPPEDPSPIPRTRPKSAIFDDEEKSKLLQKLLQSKKPEDLQHANRLIKTMVREEERRNEEESVRAQEVCIAVDSAGLLRDMLARAALASRDERALIRDLHTATARVRPALTRLAATATATALDEILHASDMIDEVCEMYQAFVAECGESDPDEPPSNDALLDFAGANVGQGDGQGDGQHANTTKPSTLDDLGDIFANGTSTANIVEPLKPVNVMKTDDVDLLGEKSKTEGWNELDSLSEQLLKQSLQNNARRADGFNSKTTKKIPMNALEKASPKKEAPPNNNSILDLDFFTTPTPGPAPVTSHDDAILNIATHTHTNNNVNSKPDSPLEDILGLSKETKTEPQENIAKETVTSEVRPLTDIDVTLESVQPSALAPLAVFDEGGLAVVLHFCKDKPRPDVNVLVISTTSKNKLPIEDYKFQAVVPKGCKVRLLTASSTSLPAYNPFLPPPALTQVMLIGRPSPAPLHLKFVISYTCQDEVTSEMGEVKELPLHLI